jgi:hypothetical protein
MVRFSYLLFCLAFFTIPGSMTGQIQITGTITDTQQQAIEWVTVIVSPSGSNTILGHGQSDSLGQYVIELDKPPTSRVLEIKTSRLGYRAFRQQVILEDTLINAITLPIKLTPEGHELSAVTVKASQPVIVKKDTIIYDVEHYAATRDESLQDVLKRMPGFDLQPGGAILVNGQLIRKVVINGEEMPTSDPALVTKSIPADFAATIEVRFDEQDKKIKESLLSEEPFAVLDIQLKEGINLNLFGKGKANVGQADRPQVGAYANLYSIQKRVRLHGFVEHDAFGDQNIELYMLENLGNEAVAEQFRHGNNIRDYASSEGYQTGFFGDFKTFTQHQRTVAGLATKIPGKKSDLFVGSFNFRQKVGQQRTQNITALNQKTFNWVNSQTTEQWFSLNKIDWRVYGNQSKLRVLGGFKLDQHQADATFYHRDGLNTSPQLAMNDAPIQHAFWVNPTLDLKGKNGGGLSLAYLVRRDQQDVNQRFQSSDVDFAQSLLLADPNTPFDFSTRQDIIINQQSFSATGHTKINQHLKIRSEASILYEGQRRWATNQLNTADSMVSLSAFQLPQQGVGQTTYRTTTGLRFRKNTWGVDLDVGWMAINSTLTESAHHDLIVKASLKKNPVGYDHYELTYENRPGFFALGDMFAYQRIMGNQLFRQGVSNFLAPTNNHRLTLSAGKMFQDLNLRVSTYSHYHRTFNGYVVSPVGRDNAWVTESPSAQRNELTQASLLFVKFFRQSSWQLRLLPYYVTYRSPVDPSEIEQGDAIGRSMDLALTASSDGSDSPWSFSGTVKIARFAFGTEALGTLGRQDLLWFNSSFSRALGEDKLIVNAEASYVVAPDGSGGVSAPVFNLGIKLPSTRMQWSIQVHNLLDVAGFNRHQFSPFQWQTNTEALFGRYVKVAGNFKFR